MEASWAPLGASWGSLGALLRCSWEPSERSWGHLGGDLSKKGGLLISLAPLECLESPLGLPKRPKSFQNLKKINVCCFLAFSLLEPSWAILDVPTTRETPRPGQWGGVRGGVIPSPKGKKGVGRGNSLDHLRPKGLVGLGLFECARGHLRKARESSGGGPRMAI